MAGGVDRPHNVISISIATMRGITSISGTKTAKLFTHGRSQAVRLPKELRLPGKEVRVSRAGHRVILEPIARSPEDVAAVFAEMDRLLAGEPFPDVRPPDDPPVAPEKRAFVDS
jgi:antitoxin VapB